MSIGQLWRTTDGWAQGREGVTVESGPEHRVYERNEHILVPRSVAETRNRTMVRLDAVEAVDGRTMVTMHAWVKRPDATDLRVDNDGRTVAAWAIYVNRHTVDGLLGLLGQPPIEVVHEVAVARSKPIGPDESHSSGAASRRFGVLGCIAAGASVIGLAALPFVGHVSLAIAVAGWAVFAVVKMLGRA